MILLELNEFNPDLLRQYADRLDLKHIKRMLGLKHTSIRTDDKEERYGLDPWVQWVSIHTGQCSEQHGIKHLGDIDQLPKKTLQLWDALYTKFGARFSVWGAMNASYLTLDGCDNFFPDPWTFTVNPHPSSLNSLMAFPRFYAKNYLNLKQTASLTNLFKTAIFFLRHKNLPLIPKIFGESANAIFQIGLNTNTLFCLFDSLSTELFIRKAKNSDFKVLFLNSIAHLQHHYWNNEKHNQNIMFCLKNLNSILGNIFRNFPNEPLIITNAFRQVQSYDNHEFLYRQKNPEDFLKKLGIKFSNTEQLMTNDSHIFFDSIKDMNAAQKTLNSISISQEKVFHIESDEQNLKLFMQFKLWNDFPSGALLHTKNSCYSFYEHFEKVVQRTGTHIPCGDVFSQGVELPQAMLNHELSNYIVNHYQKRNDHSYPPSV